MAAQPRSFQDTAIWVILSSLTNLAGLPAIVVVWKRGLIFESVIMFFTFVTSFMYHFCESVQLNIWLSEGQWHKMDNIGSIMCFVLCFLYLADLKDQMVSDTLKYLFLMVVILLQEKSPWNLLFTILPIVVAGAIFVGSRFFLQAGIAQQYNQTYLKYALCLHWVGVVFFVRALDDKTDPYRIFHGGWHLFTGTAAYFDWQLLPMRSRKGLKNVA
jgi:hypothetical protein